MAALGCGQRAALPRDDAGKERPRICKGWAHHQGMQLQGWRH